ncbi:MAG: radical SAM protein [Candidatus Methanodesulfokora sp.]
MLYSQSDRGVICEVCERRCLIPAGRKGACGNYMNLNGRLKHIGYGDLSAVESRPIELKPLFHYWPNSTALTFSNWGCNFYCPWCQNDHISFRWPSGKRKFSPEDLVERALREGDEGMSASFNEPTTNFDFIIDVFSLASKRGLYSMMVTNGYQTERAMRMLIDAGADGWSIDVKGCPSMADRKVLPHINHEISFRNAKLALEMGGHVEIVFLVVPKANDFEGCVDWLLDKHLSLLGPDVPLHINRYFPAHLWKEPPTPVKDLLSLAERARKEGIKYVYVGNIGDPELESTKCPNCGKILIRRSWHRVTYFSLVYENGVHKCPRCGHRIYMRGRYIPK